MSYQLGLHRFELVYYLKITLKERSFGALSTPALGRADIEVPNTTVAVDARVVPACYPRSSFCLLSFRDPTIYGRITNTCFRICAAYVPCSQAGLCVCTIAAISIRS